MRRALFLLLLLVPLTFAAGPAEARLPNATDLPPDYIGGYCGWHWHDEIDVEEGEYPHYHYHHCI